MEQQEKGAFCMRTRTIEKVVTNSIVCGYAVTQPFALYVDAQPLLQDKLLAEAEGMEYGDHSEIVRHLQHKLTELGYYEDAIDGVFGLLTEHAVKGFQSSHEIQITGKADKKTMETLIWEEKKEHINEIKDMIDSIYFGDINNDVRIVQEVLFYYGYYTGTVDGVYGPLTDEAIQQIKNEHLIEVPVIEEVMQEESKDEQSEVPREAPVQSQTEVSVQTTEDVHEQEQVLEEQSIRESKEEQEEDTAIPVQVKEAGPGASVVQSAKDYIGTPYVWGGTSPGGFDCSGFIQFVYEEHDKIIPRTVNEIWNFSSHVDTPSIGDLVFFETYQPGPSHLGIYLGNGDFIHAGSSRGVEVSNISNEYWNTRYLGAKRVY